MWLAPLRASCQATRLSLIVGTGLVAACRADRELGRLVAAQTGRGRGGDGLIGELGQVAAVDVPVAVAIVLPDDDAAADRGVRLIAGRVADDELGGQVRTAEPRAVVARAPVSASASRLQP